MSVARQVPYGVRRRAVRHNIHVNRAIARAARDVSCPPIERDPDLVSRYLEDAAHFPGGHAFGVARPHTVEEVAALVRAAQRVLIVGARSSLTGGATPAGDLVVSTEYLRSVSIGNDRVTAGAGVTLDTLQRELHAQGSWLPPVPTFLGATVGGAVSTNAAGAATFKYGSMRPWVYGITVVLASGDVLTLERGQVTAAPDGTFEIATSDRLISLQLPSIEMPHVPKHSAGYFAAPRMDLVDLFVGSEGTLGVVVSVTFNVAPRPAASCRALVPVNSERDAIHLVDALRRVSQDTWRRRNGAGVDVAAIEHIDRRTLEILREDGVDRRLNVSVPSGTEVVLLLDQELTEDARAADPWMQLANARAADASPTAIGNLCRILDRHGVLEDTEIALPGDTTRTAALTEFRESVPDSVNRRVGQAHQLDPRIHKTAADMIVPFDRFQDMMRVCRMLFSDRGLDVAVWGHISDGNVHPNVIPRSFDDMQAGTDAILELGREVIAMGGCPLAEHGVGRNPVKQQLLRMLYGENGLTAMRRVKLCLDPEEKLARGVLFAESSG